jgi:hypothetical protein
VSFVRVAALIAMLLVGCAPTASAPTPTASTATSPTASPTPSPAPKRIQSSETPFPTVAGPFVIFQLPSETRLRALSFGGDVNGRLEGGGAGQTSASAGWSQSPYGAPYLVGTTIYDRDGKSLGTIPWSGKESKTWSSDGRFLCAAVPESATAGAQMRLETALIGQPPKVVATGYTTYSDNAVYRVLACDQGTDRAIVASFGQGVTPSMLWVFRLSTGAIVRSVDYAGVIGWVAGSADGSMLAESSAPVGAATNRKTTIRYADSGAQLARIDDLVGRGFSGDKTLLVGNTPGAVAVVDWKTGRKVWTTSGPYGGFLAEPAGRRIALGIGFVGGSDQRDVYLVSPDGSAPLLPERVRVALLY